MNKAVTELLERVSKKKARLDSLRPLPPERVKNLDEWFKIELTYTSNALSGNTLTREQTAAIIKAADKKKTIK